MNNETLVRPYPPHEFLEAFSPYIKIIPAPEINAWVQQHLLDDNGDIHNPDHTHLIDADICFMWASNAFSKKGRDVLGQCEEVMMRAGGWQKARMEQQMYEWFGRILSLLSHWRLITVLNVLMLSFVLWSSMSFII